MKTIINKILRRLYTYFMLFVLKFYKLKLFLYKKAKGIKNPIVHVYTAAWNEEKIMPFFLKNYSAFAEKIFVYDNESDDNTLNIIKQNPKSTIKTYKTNGTFNDVIKNNLYNNSWKQSRGKADWVIVCDTDELLFAKNKKDILEILETTDKTIFKPEGYEMISEKFPDIVRPLTEQTKGIKSHWFNKQIIFNPHKIVDINYYLGCHDADPRGIKKYGENEFYLLHFKRMSVEYVIQRYRQLAQRLSETNKEQKLGMHYYMKEKQITDEFNQMLKNAKPIE